MQLVHLIKQVLDTGVLPMSVERGINRLLASTEFSDTELAAIDELLNALATGMIRPIA
ncbi:hypothetical protein ACN4EK_17145 [Pantanalinema rosaneae CENA516]|uniref:hypothetical protein n=1 Tax=Pantanalinema rosaneae TaxID=1620701 RepID=UPI003D6DD41F